MQTESTGAPDSDVSEPVYFCSPGKDWGELSNFWPTNTPLPGPDGLTSRSAEHLYWVLMYTYPDMNHNTRLLREYINGSSTPLKARYYATGVPRYRTRNNQDKWRRAIVARRTQMCGKDLNELSAAVADPIYARQRPYAVTDRAVQLAVMREVLNVKFLSNDRARDTLMQTGTRTLLADLGEYDEWWGIGKRDPETGEITGKGQNILGLLLAEWRDLFAQSQLQSQ